MTQIKPITPLMFVDDAKLLEYKINPGDEVRCLGYPLGAQSNEAGFPILRSGKIASYPLTPTIKTKTFLVDLRIFKGNSGGPVFVVENNRPVPGTISGYQNFHFIIGLVSEEKLFNEQRLVHIHKSYTRRNSGSRSWFTQVLHCKRSIRCPFRQRSEFRRGLSRSGGGGYS